VQNTTPTYLLTPDNHHSSDNVSWRTGDLIVTDNKAKVNTPAPDPGGDGQTSSSELLACLHAASLASPPLLSLASAAVDQNPPVAENNIAIK